MIAAIYARKSNEQLGVGDEEKSVTRQIEHATAYALKKGWTVSDEHIYSDDGISGAEFVKHPGFIRLMNTLKPKPPFQVLVMSEKSRLGREQKAKAYALQQITDARVRVFFYLSDQECRLDSAMDKMMTSLMNFGAELEPEKASERTHDALAMKEASLYVTGCKVFGAVENDGSRQRLHVVRRINDAASLGGTWQGRGPRDRRQGIQRPRGVAAAWPSARVGPDMHSGDPASAALSRGRRLE